MEERRPLQKSKHLGSIAQASAADLVTAFKYLLSNYADGVPQGLSTTQKGKHYRKTCWM